MLFPEVEVTKSLSRNLLKAGWVTFNEDTRIIDTNSLIERRLREEARKQHTYRPQAEVSDGGNFSEGLEAENVNALLDEESENAVLKSASLEEQEQLNREIEAARAELEQIKAEASRVMDKAEAEISAMKAQAYEDAKKRGYQEGYAKGMGELEAMQAKCQEEAKMLEQEYQQRVQELEPSFVTALTDIYEHIFKVDLGKYETLVYQLLTDTLLKIDGAKNVMIHVSKEDYSMLQEQKEMLLEETGMMGNSVEIVSDATLAKNQCMIETDNGIYDCSLDTELEGLKRKLSLLSFQ